MNRVIEAVEAAAVAPSVVAAAAVVLLTTEDTRETDLGLDHFPQDQEDEELQLTLQFGDHHFQGHDLIQDQIIKTN